jgi:hypothetical protein
MRSIFILVSRTGSSHNAMYIGAAGHNMCLYTTTTAAERQAKVVRKSKMNLLRVFLWASHTLTILCLPEAFGTDLGDLWRVNLSDINVGECGHTGTSRQS